MNGIYMKVHEEAGGKSREPEVGDDLRLVYWKDLGDRLNLDHELILNHEVEAIAALELHSLVDDRQWYLP